MAEERFHIAEWYGRPFHRLEDPERVRLAGHTVGGAAMKKAEVERLVKLEAKSKLDVLNAREIEALASLRGKLERQQAEELPCPFRTDTPYPTCTKRGGVCSIRIYRYDEVGIAPVGGAVGRLRALCPWRFHQNSTAFKQVGEQLLGDANPIRAGEVGFLESTGNIDSQPGEDVGRIDMILVKSNGSPASKMEWVAVEVQAVYFSGKNMDIEFKNLSVNGGKLSMPVAKRRPDYRSSGVKRLMPQLQIKVPTLRRWGKKMAVIVDVAFFNSMGAIKREEHVSNADIVWYLADFIEDPTSEKYELSIVDEFYTTLEDANVGLTGGKPLTQENFEKKISAKVQKLPLQNQ